MLNSQIGAEIDIGIPGIGTPTVTVTGTGSTWNVGGSFGFGLNVGGGSTLGPGALVISNGGIVNLTAFTAVGDEADHSSRIVVTGAGSVLNAFNLLQIGDTSCGCNLVGTLTIEDGGLVNSPGTTSIGQGSTFNLGTPLNLGPVAWLARSTPRRSPTTGRSSPTSPTLRPSVPTSPAPAR